ncbi:hypothetical protein RJ639_037612 [Escallonia herrerae]|uniref:BTB/POZ domain-containing protein At3g05675-like n=1 Tax=Escallonia herrerae TaxID=1293975 RepID=A0AA89B782_9ASTE|nr:hypothetical protein RJ639_037612 [Escallonia herrerae]
MSSPPPTMNDLKTSAQEQLEYMLTEDDDAPLLTADNEIKVEARECMKKLFTRFNSLVESLLCESKESVSNAEKLQPFQSYLADLLWACQILAKLEIMRELVSHWVEASEHILKVLQLVSLEAAMLEMKLKVIEVTTKVSEAIGYGTVILPTAKRLHMVRIWLPHVRALKPLMDSSTNDVEDVLKMDGELWQSLESAFVSIILTLPSLDQAEILSDWLGNKDIRYPDLTEAIEVWCYRSKVANKRLAYLGGTHGMARML